jgi:hypothetical protein
MHINEMIEIMYMVGLTKECIQYLFLRRSIGLKLTFYGIAKSKN